VVEGYTERRILEKFYAVGLRTEPALIVRGSSRRITIMRFRPANIRVINRRFRRCCLSLAPILPEKHSAFLIRGRPN